MRQLWLFCTRVLLLLLGITMPCWGTRETLSHTYAKDGYIYELRQLNKLTVREAKLCGRIVKSCTLDISDFRAAIARVYATNHFVFIFYPYLVRIFDTRNLCAPAHYERLNTIGLIQEVEVGLPGIPLLALYGLKDCIHGDKASSELDLTEFAGE